MMVEVDYLMCIDNCVVFVMRFVVLCWEIRKIRFDGPFLTSKLYVRFLP